MVPSSPLRIPVPSAPGDTSNAADNRNAPATAEEIRFQRNRANGIRKLGAWCAAALIFVRFSAIHETIAHFLGHDIYLLYLLAIPGALAWVLSGAFRRTFPPGSSMRYWLVFTGLMLLATPFSFWIGGSVGIDLVYLKTVLPSAILVAGLPLTWQECRRVAYAIALAAVVIIISARLFVDETARYAGRTALEMQGTISNPNDLAGILVVTLPFVLFIIIRPGTPAWIRIAAGLVIIAGLYTLLHTASRGALLGLGASLIMLLVRATTRQRLVFLAAGSVALIVMFAVLPDAIVQRLFSFREGSENVSEEALESQRSREYLLKRSLEFTVTHPVFGVGPGNFMIYEDFDSREQGKGKGSWHVAHNTYTQVSAECGVPALMAYLAAIILNFRAVTRVYKMCRRRPELKDVRDLAFCFGVALSGFCVTLIFLPFSYHAFLPMLGGFSVSFEAAARREAQQRGLSMKPGVQRNPAPMVPGAAVSGVMAGAPRYSA